MHDHVHMLIEIPPKHKVSEVVGFLKGKSAIAVAREFGGKQRNFTGEHFWARGYAVSTVGFEEEVIRKYIEDQETDERPAAQGAF
jgi:putative transposase